MPVQTIPILPVKDMSRAVAFYRSLGFEVAHDYGGYTIITLGDVELHLSGFDGHDPLTTASCLYLRASSVAEMDALWARMAGAAAIAPSLDDAYPACAPARVKVRPASITDYGMYEFSITDADNNLIRVGAVTRMPK